MPIEPGIFAEISHIVTESDTAASYGSGLVRVLSTPHLIALMENAAQAALDPYMEPGQSAVGTRVAMQHLAATPVGMEVLVRAELLEVDRRRLRFRVEAWDETEQVGTCEHERFIIDTDRFMQRVEAKQREEAG